MIDSTSIVPCFEFRLLFVPALFPGTRIQPPGGREPFTVVNLSDWPDVSSKDGSKFKVG